MDNPVVVLNDWIKGLGGKISDFFRSMNKAVGFTDENGVNIAQKLQNGVSDFADSFGTGIGSINKLLQKFVEDPETYWDYFRNGRSNEYNLLQTQETNLANKEMTESTNESNRLIQESVNQSNKDIASETNAINKQIADENLGYQRELFEYNKALQDKLFEREDTSYQRTAKDMLSAGLNPLSMQGTNGSGSVVTQSALNNQYQAQQSSPMTAYQKLAPQFEKFQMMSAGAESVISTIASVGESISNLFTGKQSRDMLTLQKDKQALENLIYAHSYGLKFDNSKNNNYSGFNIFSENPSRWNQTSGYKLYGDYNDYFKKNRELSHMINNEMYDTDLREERILTALEDWTKNGRLLHVFDSITDSGMQLLNKLISK